MCRRVDAERSREGRSPGSGLDAIAGGRAARCGAAGKDLDNDHADRRSKGSADSDRSWRLDRRCRALPAAQPPPLEQPSTAWRARCWLAAGAGEQPVVADAMKPLW
jgi:hypothetical protein